MILRLSRFIHLLPLGDERVLVIHAVSHLRLVVDQDLAGMIAFFAEPRELPPEQAGGGAFAALTERGILTDKTPEEELATVAAELAPITAAIPRRCWSASAARPRKGRSPTGPPARPGRE